MVLYATQLLPLILLPSNSLWQISLLVQCIQFQSHLFWDRQQEVKKKFLNVLM